MNLYERDFKILTDEEYSEWQAIRQKEIISRSDKLSIRKNLFQAYPKAARHFDSLFPNNYLDIIELKAEVYLRSQLDEFKVLINSPDVNERQILNFIKAKTAYFIIASLLKSHFNFGHHDAFLFREFPLGTSYKADYLLIGRSSDGWSFVFVELESPNQDITLADGGLGLSFRKGLSQVEDWETWLDAAENIIGCNTY